MNRMTRFAAASALTIAFAFFAFGPMAQGQAPQPSSHSQSALPAQQLVAWTWMQEPQPALTQLFIGKIIRIGNAYVLRVPGNTTYQVNEQKNARSYENQEVKIIGSIEAGSNLIRVLKIDLLVQPQSARELR